MISQTLAFVAIAAAYALYFLERSKRRAAERREKAYKDVAVDVLKQLRESNKIMQQQTNVINGSGIL